MGLRQIVPPAALPVSLAEARTIVGVHEADTSHDARLGLLLPAAVEAVERFTGLALAPQTWRLTLDAFSDAIELPRWPVSAVTTVNYRDPAGDAQVVGGSVWQADLESEPARVVRRVGQAWPKTLDAVNAVWIDFACGWAAGALPAGLKRAVLGMTTQMFDFGIYAEMPAGVSEALMSWRRWS